MSGEKELLYSGKYWQIPQLPEETARDIAKLLVWHADAAVEANIQDGTLFLDEEGRVGFCTEPEDGAELSVDFLELLDSIETKADCETWREVLRTALAKLDERIVTAPD